MRNKEDKHQWYLRNKERLAPKYHEHYVEHKQEKYEYDRKRYSEKRDSILKYSSDVYNTKEGRALHLLIAYNATDKQHNRGKGDLTPEWIIEHIFSQPCAHCGKTGWNVIGCNRLDVSKPHTMDNVEPCCWECNNEIEKERQKKKVCQLTLSNELVKIWDSVNEAGRNGFNSSGISNCCNGKYKKSGGFKWQFLKDMNIGGLKMENQ